MINNRQLEIFVAVYEENNMTRAAKKMYMTQPAVSQTIREIEEEYLISLFERSGSKLHVTQAGEKLYQYAKRIFQIMDDMRSEMTMNEATTEIRVGCNVSAGTALIRGYIKDFQTLYPNIKISVLVSRSAVLEERINNRDIDFAIMEDLVHSADQMIQIPYYKDRIVIVAASDHPLVGKKEISLHHLTSENFLLRERGAGVRDKFEYILKINDIYIEPLWESSTTKALVNAVLDGIGIAVLPYLLVKEYLEMGIIVELPIKGISLNRNLNIVYHKDKILTKPIESFISLIRQSESKSSNQ